MVKSTASQSALSANDHAALAYAPIHVLAENLQSGALTASALVDCYLQRIRRHDEKLPRLCRSLRGRSARGGGSCRPRTQGRPAARPAARHPDRAQGPHRHRGQAHDRRLDVLARAGFTRHRDGRAAPCRRRHDHARQNAHGGIRVRRVGHESNDGHAVESVGCRAHRARPAARAAVPAWRWQPRSRPPRSAATPAARCAFPRACAASSGSKPPSAASATTARCASSETLDTLGPMTRDVEDAALLFMAMHGPDPQRRADLAAPAGGCAERTQGRHRGHCASPYCRKRNSAKSIPKSRARSRVRSMSCADSARASTPAQLPLAYQRLADLIGKIIAAEGYALHRAWIDRDDLPFDRDVRDRIRWAKTLSAADYIQVMAERADAATPGRRAAARLRRAADAHDAAAGGTARRRSTRAKRR